MRTKQNLFVWRCVRERENCTKVMCLFAFFCTATYVHSMCYLLLTCLLLLYTYNLCLDYVCCVVNVCCLSVYVRSIYAICRHQLNNSNNMFYLHVVCICRISYQMKSCLTYFILTNISLTFLHSVLLLLCSFLM